MRIVIASALLHPRHGGPAEVVRIQYEILRAFVDVVIVGVVDVEEYAEVKKIYPNSILFLKKSPKRWFYSSEFKKGIEKCLCDVDLIHLHMLWDYPVYALYRYARKTKIKYVITLHGTLSELWRWSSLHKRVYRYLVADKIINNADAVHCLTKKEKMTLRSIGFNSRIKVIPNAYYGVKIREDDLVRDNLKYISNELLGKKYILFLGRLWSEKGLDILPDAWERVVKKNKGGYLLVIAGPDYKGYEVHLRQKIAMLGITDSVLILGEVRDVKKQVLINNAEYFVLPSKSEGLSMSIIEAAGAGIPAIYSKECNMPELAQVGGGWEVKRDIDELSDHMCMAIDLNENERVKMSKKASSYIRSNFSSYVVGLKLIEMYEELL